MEQVARILGRLEWWQQPLAILLPFLLAALILPMLFTMFVGIPLDALRGRFPREDRRKGLEHLAYGFGLFLVACGLTWLAWRVQIDWLGGHEHLVMVGAFFVAAYEILYGAGIWLFRTGVLGVLGGVYVFLAYCLYGLLHWTLGWI